MPKQRDFFYVIAIGLSVILISLTWQYSFAEVTKTGLGPEMILVEAGTFEMGSADILDDDETPVHTVTINQPFSMSRYEVTFDLYDKFCEETGRENQQIRGGVEQIGLSSMSPGWMPLCSATG